MNGAMHKRFRLGLVVGKFCPLHKGHEIVTYLPARGIYVHDVDADALNRGNANPIPPLKMVPSTINF